LAFCPLCTSLSHHTALELNEPCNLCGWKVLTGKTCGKWSCDELGKTPTDLVLLRFDLNADFFEDQDTNVKNMDLSVGKNQ